MKILNKFTIKNRLIVLIVLVGLILLVLSGAIFASNTNKNLFEEKEHQISYLTESSFNLVGFYKEKVKNGEMTLENAQQVILSAISSMNYDGQNYVWVNDYDGVMLAHPKKELIGTNVIDMKDKQGNKLFLQMIEIAKTKGEGSYKYWWAKPGTNPNNSYPKLSYVRGIDDWKWMIGTGIYIDDVQSSIYSSLVSVMLSCFVILILLIFVAYFTIGKSIIDPINKITDISKMIANNDLTVEIEDDDAKTEIGELNRSFKFFVSNLKTLISQVIESVEEVTAGSQQMGASSEQTAEGAQQVAQSVEQLAKGSQEMANDVSNSLESVNTVHTAIQNISDSAQNTVNISASTEENASNGKKQASEAVDKINQIKTTSANVSDTINELGALSAEIEAIVDLIKTIASQTNLLALNAAIEAARAGEHGKGFAVVAEEVKKLAGESAEATDKITTMIKEIQGKTNAAVVSMDEAVKEVGEGVVIIENTGQSLDEILKAAQLTSKEIAEIAQEVGGVSKNADDIVKMMENISSITEETSASAEEISSIAEEQSASTEEISSSAVALSKIAEKLQEYVLVFKV